MWPWRRAGLQLGREQQEEQILQMNLFNSQLLLKEMEILNLRCSKGIKQTLKSQIRKCWGFPQKSSALFSLKIHFNKKWKAFWLQIFGWEVLGLQHFQYFGLVFFPY